jgi:hypothetical protein
VEAACEEQAKALQLLGHRIFRDAIKMVRVLLSSETCGAETSILWIERRRRMSSKTAYRLIDAAEAFAGTKLDVSPVFVSGTKSMAAFPELGAAKVTTDLVRSRLRAFRRV